MSTPASIEAEFGWALGTVTRNYLRVAGGALAEVPGGPKGYLVLSSLGTGQPSTQVALAQHLGVDRTMMTYLLDDLEEAVAGADVVLLLTEWPQYTGLDPAALGRLARNRTVIDGRNALDPATWRAAGWAYRGIGRAL